MIVTFLGLQFHNSNLGCQALTYSFVQMLEKIAKQNNFEITYQAVTFETPGKQSIPELGIDVDCLKIKFKQLSFWKSLKEYYKKSDLVVDFTGGDSFSDIYGKVRFSKDWVLKRAAIKYGKKYMLGPQTYGPYKSKIVQKMAKSIINKADYVYSRDKLSQEYVEKLSGRKIGCTTDVAFALSCDHLVERKAGKKYIGINPSGLLWKGGYTTNNQFGLTVDYQEYLTRLIESLLEDDNNEIYFIPHVCSDGEEYIDNDYFLCNTLAEKYPGTKTIGFVENPIEVKSYISCMDVLVAARMHASIGAFSTGVATIPFSYSRKFEGLYDNLGYDYVISATALDTEMALNKTLEYINNYEELKAAVKNGLESVHEKQKYFYDALEKICLLYSN